MLYVVFDNAGISRFYMRTNMVATSTKPHIESLSVNGRLPSVPILT